MGPIVKDGPAPIVGVQGVPLVVLIDDEQRRYMKRWTQPCFRVEIARMLMSF